MTKKVVAMMMVLSMLLCFITEAGACTCCDCCCARNSSESTATKILAACRVVTDTFIDRPGVYYSTSEDLVWGNIASSYQSTGICSTTYVSLVLYVSGILEEGFINKYNYNWSGNGGLSSMLQDAGWFQVDPSQIAPGDIAINPGSHAMICDSQNRYWDQYSCTGSSATGNPVERYDITGWNVYRAQ